MPSYIYICTGCGDRRDVWHYINESPDILCGLCDLPMVRKPTVGGVSFAGNGWGKD